MVDCPCGYGKNIPENQSHCPACGMDLGPLHRLRAVPRSLLEEGKRLLEEGKVMAGMERLSAAVGLDPGMVEGYVFLGDAYARKGLTEEALDAYRKALQGGSTEEEVEAKISDMEKRRARPSPGKRARPVQALVLSVFAFLVGLAVVPAYRALSGPGEPAPDLSLRAGEIEKNIAGHPQLGRLGIEIRAAEGGISLSGSVPSGLHKSLLEELCTRLAPGCPLDLNRVEVISPVKEPEREPVFIRYTVRPNDTLVRIAAVFYGDSRRWRRIFEANKEIISSPKRIDVGQVLHIPLDEERRK